jgi:hypothetical protein
MEIEIPQAKGGAVIRDHNGNEVPRYIKIRGIVGLLPGAQRYRALMCSVIYHLVKAYLASSARKGITADGSAFVESLVRAIQSDRATYSLLADYGHEQDLALLLAFLCKARVTRNVDHVVVVAESSESAHSMMNCESTAYFYRPLSAPKARREMRLPIFHIEGLDGKEYVASHWSDMMGVKVFVTDSHTRALFLYSSFDKYMRWLVAVPKDGEYDDFERLRSETGVFPVAPKSIWRQMSGGGAG